MWTNIFQALIFCNNNRVFQKYFYKFWGQIPYSKTRDKDHINICLQMHISSIACMFIWSHSFGFFLWSHINMPDECVQHKKIDICDPQIKVQKIEVRWTGLHLQRCSYELIFVFCSEEFAPKFLKVFLNKMGRLCNQNVRR